MGRPGAADMDVAVIGAGWAGCAAAVTLARLGHQVTVFESAGVAGGRARRVTRAGMPLDNGPHLMLGAYMQTRNMLAVVNGGDGERGLVRTPLAIEPFGAHASPLTLRARRLPAPFGLLAGLLTAKGLLAGERFGLVAWFRRLERAGFHCAADATVADMLKDGPAVASRQLWIPLCLASLNTPPERASAQVFANVLRAAFTTTSDASDFLFATADQSSLFPDAALRYVAAHGGHIALRTRARLESVDERGIVVTHGQGEKPFDAAVIAVGPHQLDAAVAPHPALSQALEAARELAYEPIATAWLGYATRSPMTSMLARLDDAPGQWVFERADVLARAAADDSRPALAQMLAVVISASGPHESLGPQALADACDMQLRRLMPALPSLAWSQTIVEQRATYACTPHRPRANATLPHPRVALAGDWLDAEFPATLEAAVRTGVSAAFELEAAFKRN